MLILRMLLDASNIQFLLLYSAKVVVELAKAGEIQAAVLCHPSFVTVDDIKGKRVLIFQHFTALLRTWFRQLVFFLCLFAFTFLLPLLLAFCWWLSCFCVLDVCLSVYISLVVPSYSGQFHFGSYFGLASN